MPSALLASRAKAKAASVSRTGHSYRPILAMASASYVTAMSELSMEP